MVGTLENRSFKAVLRRVDVHGWTEPSVHIGPQLCGPWCSFGFEIICGRIVGKTETSKS